MKEERDGEVSLRRRWWPERESSRVSFVPDGRGEAFCPGGRFFVLVYECEQACEESAAWEEALARVLPYGSKWHGCVACGAGGKQAFIVVDFGGVERKRVLRLRAAKAVDLAIQGVAPVVGCLERSERWLQREARAASVNRVVWGWQEKIRSRADAGGGVVGAEHVVQKESELREQSSIGQAGIARDKWK